MTTITIPKKIAGEKELVAIPRREYEELLSLAKKGERAKLDRGLDEAIAEYKAGKIFGPFRTAKEGIKFLESRRTLKAKK